MGAVCLLALVMSPACFAGRTNVLRGLSVSPADETCSPLHGELRAIIPAECLANNEIVMRFSNGTFAAGEYSLEVRAQQTLEQMAQILGRYPDYIIIVEGHTDTSGDASYNQWLSERRSRVVADFLASRGVDPYRMQVVGYGESHPLTTDTTSEGRRQNRRIEIHIKPKQ